MSVDVTLHISAPYRRIEITQLLKILSLVCLLYVLDLQISHVQYTRTVTIR